MIVVPIDKHTEAVRELKKQKELAIAKKARDLFHRKGGAKGRTTDLLGRICATEALRQAAWDYRASHPWHLEYALDEIAIELYNDPLLIVNDATKGKDSVLEIFDKFIEQTEEKLS